MPKIIRPRQEFPTPLFRAFVGALAGVVGGLPAWILAPRWDNPGPPLAIVGLAAFVVAVAVASLGTTARRLAVAFAIGVLAMLAGFALVTLLTFAFGNFE